MRPSVKKPVSDFERYDKRYFDKWYRDPKHRVSTPAGLSRRAALVLSMAEYYLERKVRTVLDVGCGEGQWQPVLAKLRPGISYTGVDPSEYAIKRYARRRNLFLGTFGNLPQIGFLESYDLVLCSNVLYYVPGKELDLGMAELVPRIGGVAFLEAYASDGSLKGDTASMEKRDGAFYRRLFRRHGLMSCGSHCYVGPMLAGQVTDLERGGVW
jgi:SAM-dependent methyltransferase